LRCERILAILFKDGESTGCTLALLHMHGAEIRLNELLSVIQLYKALGGGWS